MIKSDGIKIRYVNTVILTESGFELTFSRLIQKSRVRIINMYCWIPSWYYFYVRNSAGPNRTNFLYFLPVQLLREMTVDLHTWAKGRCQGLKGAGHLIFFARF